MAILGVEITADYAGMQRETKKVMAETPAAFFVLKQRMTAAKEGNFDALQHIGQRVVEIAAMMDMIEVDTMDGLCAFVEERLRNGGQNRMADLLKRIARMRDQRIAGVGDDGPPDETPTTDKPVPDISHLTRPVPADSEMKIGVGGLPVNKPGHSDDPLEDL